MGLEGIEHHFFLSESEKEITLDSIIENETEFEYLNYVSCELHGTKTTEREVDFFLSKYNNLIKNKFDKYSAKRKSILETMDYISRRHL